MSNISWHQLSDPNFASGNNLLLQGRGMWDKAIQQVNQGVNNFAQAVENRNTNTLMDALYAAKDPTQFQSADFQNNLAGLRSQMGQDYDREKFRTAMDSRLGKLQADGLNAIKYQDANQEVANRAANTNWLNAYASGDSAGMQQAAAQMQGGLRPEMLTQGMGLRKDQHGMTMQDKEYNLSLKKANWDHENDIQKLNLQREELDAKGNGLSGVTDDGGISLTTGGDLTSGYGAVKVPKEAQAYAPMVSSASKQHGVPEHVLYGVMHTESTFNPNARSGAGAEGLMQITPITKKHLKMKNAYDPAEAINGSAQYLSELTKRFGSLERGLAAYNMGPTAYQSYVEGKRTMPQETRDYVKKVVARSAQYRGDAKGVTDSATVNDIVATGKAKFKEDTDKATAKRTSLGMYASAKEVKDIPNRNEWRNKNNTIEGRSVYTGAMDAVGFKDLTPPQQTSLLQSAMKAERNGNTKYYMPDFMPFKGGMRYTEKMPRNEWVKKYIETEIQKDKDLIESIKTSGDKSRTLDYHKALVDQSRKEREKAKG